MFVHVTRILPPVWNILNPNLSVWVCAELEQEASLPEKDSKTLSSDLIEYVQHMIREHGDNYKVRGIKVNQGFLLRLLRPSNIYRHLLHKNIITGVEIPAYYVLSYTKSFLSLQAMARDEKNYYQDTPKQIRRKVTEYRRCHPEQFNTFVESLGLSRPMDL